MAVYQTFPAAPLPDFPTSVKPSYAVDTVAFGDGYEVRAPAGINARTDTVTLSWTVLNANERRVLENFLDAHAPATPFFYTPFNGVQKAYTCDDWGADQTDGGYHAVRAVFKQYHGA